MSLPAEIKPTTLPHNVQRFVDILLSGRAPNSAAKLAGFETPAASACALMAREDVQIAIMQEAERRLIGDGVPAAIRCLIGLVRNKKTSPKLRKECANSILDRAGIIAPKAVDPGERGAAPLHRKSRDELLDLVNQAQVELSNRAAKVIDARQPGAQPASKPADLLA